MVGREVLNIESVRNGHMCWKFNFICIRINLSQNFARAIFPLP
jgi:hypothetical protein